MSHHRSKYNSTTWLPFTKTMETSHSPPKRTQRAYVDYASQIFRVESRQIVKNTKKKRSHVLLYKSFVFSWKVFRVEDDLVYFIIISNNTVSYELFPKKKSHLHTVIVICLWMKPLCRWYWGVKTARPTVVHCPHSR